MVNEVVKGKDPILLRKSLIVKKITPTVKKVAEEMVTFMDEHSKDDIRLIGLSACQLGHSIRMMAFRNNPISNDRDNIVILINPELVYGKKQYLVKEGCLSLPNKSYKLKRYKIVKIKGMTLNGSSRSFRGRDLLAQVFQHELDHLDGVLINQIGELVIKSKGE